MIKKQETKWVAIAVSLLFGAGAAMEPVGTPVHVAKPNAQPVVVESVFCDNEYGTAMETAILEGNLRHVDRLLSEREKAIDDVIALGSESSLNLSTVTCYYGWKARRSTTQRSEDPLILRTRAFRPNGTLFGGSTYGKSQGDHYYCTSTVCLLGTPLMIAVRAKNRFMVRELLKRGANPNVFIAVGDYSADNMLALGYANCGRNCGSWKCKRPYLCALLDCYMQMDPARVAEADEIAKMLIEHGAGFIKDNDDYGRNMLWDVARVKSGYLLSEMVNRGFDVNQEDNVGKTVADYCVEELAAGLDKELCRKFTGALKANGARFKDGRSGPDGQGGSTKPITLVLGPGKTPKPDNSAEIAMLQSQIWRLRMELEDARANSRVAAVQGTGWITASMREQDIVREIGECERRIMQLR